MLTPVCHSVHGGSGPGGCLVRGGLVLRGSSPGGSGLRGVPGGDPPGQLLLWAVRILLECILVIFIIAVRIYHGPKM